jgi:hypothetical protein
MKKFALNKIIASAIAAVIALSTGAPVFASDVQQITPGNSGSTTVKATVESEAVIWLPTNITISGTPDENNQYTGEGAVIIEGDIAGNEIITVTPESSISLKQSGKDDITAQVTQEKTTFTYDDLQNSNSAVTSISTDTLSAGEWNSVLHYNVTLDENPLPSGYTTLYEYDLSATDADDVKAYYMVPNKNTEPIEIAENSVSTISSVTASVKSLFSPVTAYAAENEDNIIEYNGVRYYLSDEDTLVISGEGEMKENIQSDLIDYQGIIDSVLEHFTNISTGIYGSSVDYNTNSYRMDDPSKDYIIYFDTYGNSYYPRWIAQKTEIIDGNMVNGKPLSNEDEFYNQVISYIDSIVSEYTVSMPKKVIINEGVTNISEKAFYNCQSLESVSISSSVSSIDKSAFYQCKNLKEIELPDSLKTIEDLAFYNTSIESIYIPDSVETIGSSAFSNCKSLNYISLPKSVKLSVGSSCSFNFFASGAKVYYRGSLNDYLQLDWGMNAFSNNIDFEFYTNDCIGSDTLNIPSNQTKIKDYAFAYGWDYITSVDMPTGVTEIGNYSFSNMKNLETVDIPNSVTTIGSSAFSYCNNLKSVTMTDSVTNIGEYAFSGCSKLTSVSLSNDLTSLPYGLFSGCSYLSEINIPEDLTSIGGNCFSGCRSLKKVDLPNSITSVGEKAFYNCNELAEITVPQSLITVGKDAFNTAAGTSAVKLTIYCETQEVADLITNNSTGSFEIVVDDSLFN